jgi:hypothetical protein
MRQMIIAEHTVTGVPAKAESISSIAEDRRSPPFPPSWFG